MHDNIPFQLYWWRYLNHSDNDGNVREFSFIGFGLFAFPTSRGAILQTGLSPFSTFNLSPPSHGEWSCGANKQAN